MKPLLVGEQNPYGADPRYALWGDPRAVERARAAVRKLLLDTEQAGAV